MDHYSFFFPSFFIAEYHILIPGTYAIFILHVVLVLFSRAFLKDHSTEYYTKNKKILFFFQILLFIPSLPLQGAIVHFFFCTQQKKCRLVFICPGCFRQILLLLEQLYFICCCDQIEQQLVSSS